MSNKHRAIQKKYELSMNVLAEMLQDGLPLGTGFCLLTFNFNAVGNAKRINYISNSNREDMIKGIREFLDLTENQP
jgi:hypothetical protein